MPDWSKEYGERVAAARKAKRLTQRELAERVGLRADQHISNLERGVPGSTPSDDVRAALERELGVVLRDPAPFVPPTKDVYANRLLVRQQPEYPTYHPRVRMMFESWRNNVGDFSSPSDWQDILDRIAKAYAEVGDADAVAFLRAMGFLTAGEPDASSVSTLVNVKEEVDRESEK